MRSLDEWIRRRLRCVILVRWRTGWRRCAELMKRGVDKRAAQCFAASSHGPWRLSGSRPMQTAFPNAFWEWLGLACVLPKAGV